GRAGRAPPAPDSPPAGGWAPGPGRGARAIPKESAAARRAGARASGGSCPEAYRKNPSRDAWVGKNSSAVSTGDTRRRPAGNAPRPGAGEIWPLQPARFQVRLYPHRPPRARMSSTERPTKRQAFLALLRDGWTSLHLDARRSGVIVPASLRGGA